MTTTKSLFEKELKKQDKDLHWHHGTCNLCGAKNILILMIGYNQQPNCYCICKNCIHENIQYIIFGSHNYKDGLID